MNRTVAYLLSGLVAALVSMVSASEEGMAPSSNVRVKALELQEQIRPLTDQVVGTVAARTKPVVSAQINGTVLVTHGETGQRVKSGEILAELASPEADARLSGAKAALDLASREFARSQQLVSNGTISKEAHDQKVAALQSAKAAVKEAETAVGYKQVRAPITGVIRARRVDPGEVTSPGKPLFDMEDEQGLRFETNIAESLSGALKPGAQVQIRVDAADKTLTGTLAEITPSADPVSRTFLVRFDLPHAPGVMAGQFGRALIPAGTARVVQAPASALVQRGQMEVVFVLDNSIAKLRLVRSGRKSDGLVELLSGVQPGERVAVTNVAQLTDGQKVEVE